MRLKQVEGTEQADELLKEGWSVLTVLKQKQANNEIPVFVLQKCGQVYTEEIPAFAHVQTAEGIKIDTRIEAGWKAIEARNVLLNIYPLLSEARNNPSCHIAVKVEIEKAISRISDYFKTLK